MVARRGMISRHSEEHRGSHGVTHRPRKIAPCMEASEMKRCVCAVQLPFPLCRSGESRPKAARLSRCGIWRSLRHASVSTTRELPRTALSNIHGLHSLCIFCAAVMARGRPAEKRAMPFEADRWFPPEAPRGVRRDPMIQKALRTGCSSRRGRSATPLPGRSGVPSMQ